MNQPAIKRMTIKHISIEAEPFDPYKRVSGFQQQLAKGSYGAQCMFAGTMRDFNLGDSVSDMTLSHYPQMTEKLLLDMIDEVVEEYPVNAVLLLHRVGKLDPGEPIVVVSVWTAHRHEAFTACRDIMEHLKRKATFWKKETVLKPDHQKDSQVASGQETGGQKTTQQRWVGENIPDASSTNTKPET
jgi:molybdopterin synthase catalytic subunit